MSLMDLTESFMELEERLNLRRDLGKNLHRSPEVLSLFEEMAKYLSRAVDLAIYLEPQLREIDELDEAHSKAQRERELRRYEVLKAMGEL